MMGGKRRARGRRPRDKRERRGPCRLFSPRAAGRRRRPRGSGEGRGKGGAFPALLAAVAVRGISPLSPSHIDQSGSSPPATTRTTTPTTFMNYQQPTPPTQLYARTSSHRTHPNSHNIDVYLDAQSLRTLAEGVLDIPETENRFFTLTKPEGDAILPLPPELSHIYVLKWANPTRIGAGAGAAYSLDVISDEPARARTRHLYITYMEEAGPSRCRVALAKAIQQLGPILYTAEEDAREVSVAVVALRFCSSALHNISNCASLCPHRVPLFTKCGKGS